MNQTFGLIDSASIHSSITALSIPKKASSWDQQCLFETTYLLLFDCIGMAPGPGAFRGARGPLAEIIRDHPFLGKPGGDQRSASNWTENWLVNRPFELKGAWDEIQKDPEFHAWAAINREMFWSTHLRLHNSLFNAEYVPHIAKLLNCPTRDLARLEKATRDESTVNDWIKHDLATGDAQLAHSAYIAAALIRGRHHEYAAAQTKSHVFHHPLRRGIGRALPTHSTQSVYTSEDFFVKALVACSLQETTAARRVKAWSTNLRKARDTIGVSGISLPNSVIESDAERNAAEALRQCGVDTTYARIRRELDYAAGLGTTTLLSLVLSPWAVLATPIVVQAYRHFRGVSVGDDIAKATLNTNKRFQRLARSVPGRIESPLKRRN